MDIQHTVLYFGLDLVGLGVLGKGEHLLELLVGEFPTEIAAVVPINGNFKEGFSSYFKFSLKKDSILS